MEDASHLCWCNIAKRCCSAPRVNKEYAHYVFDPLHSCCLLHYSYARNGVDDIKRKEIDLLRFVSFRFPFFSIRLPRPWLFDRSSLGCYLSVSLLLCSLHNLVGALILGQISNKTTRRVKPLLIGGREATPT